MHVLMFWNIVHALRALSSSSARDQVDRLLKEFLVLKESFDRGMKMEIWEVLITSGESIVITDQHPFEEY